MLKIKGVTKIYNETKTAVDELELEIGEGEIFGFIGPNGAGKTTTLKMITGIISATKGEILIGGHSIKRILLQRKKASPLFRIIQRSTMRSKASII